MIKTEGGDPRGQAQKGDKTAPEDRQFIRNVGKRQRPIRISKLFFSSRCEDLPSQSEEGMPSKGL